MQNIPMAEMDALIARVIADANVRGGHFSGFRILPNGKTVIYHEPSTARLPEYYWNRFWAIDSLIHRYNLKKDYRFLYQRHPSLKKKLPEDQRMLPGKTLPMEAQAIERCDAILWRYNHYELLSPDRHRIYDTLSALLGHSALRRTNFGTIKGTLLKHYRQKLEDTTPVADRVKLKKVIRFFDDLEYHDLA